MKRGFSKKRRAALWLIACCMSIGFVLAAPVEAAGTKQAQAAERPKPASIDLNKATTEQLESVPGIGPALAHRIIQFRKEHGSFERVDDLLKVRGIGERSLEKISPYLTVKR